MSRTRLATWRHKDVWLNFTWKAPWVGVWAFHNWWYLNHLSVEALSHFCPTVGHKNRTVCVDVNQSSSLRSHRDMKSEPRASKIQAWQSGSTGPG